ncbi:MAG: YhcH/YjgK/YiaL family protein [Negativicutes bacterium]|nr:YhcH/YjgK/YiaL family protein [Negativicutes bacterium]
MIFGHIDHFAKARELYPQSLQKGLAFLRDTDFSAMSVGRHEIDGDKMFALVQEYQPDVKENRKAETHEKYIDIQYIVSGEEIMGYANLTATAEIAENRLADKDALFYKNVENETELQASAGMFAVFFPWDVHRPGCVKKAGALVRKVVLKIKM